MELTYWTIIVAVFLLLVKTSMSQISCGGPSIGIMGIYTGIPDCVKCKEKTKKTTE